MKKNVLILIIIFLGLGLNLSASNDRMFYFMGKEDRLGSISKLASDQRGIYLKWNLVEGSLPLDIVKIKLLRLDSDGDKTLLDISSDAKMDTNAISKLFKKSSSQRDLYSIIDFIDKNDDGTCAGANLGNFAQKIYDCLDDKAFSEAAQRINFHFAMAKYRAYIDTSYNKTLSSVKYRLLGFDVSGSKHIVLGEADVKLNTTPKALVAKDFKQTRASKCNDNNYALDDFRVALNWNDGSNNGNEEFINSIMGIGYDLYYSSSTLSENEAQNIDIRALAKNKNHNSNGEVDLSSYKLKKASKITLLYPPYYESMKSLKERGFKPGDSFYYFLVSKDFTGNYGKTTYVKVTIPDLLAPLPPSDIVVLEEDTSASLDKVEYNAVIKFNTVNFKNFIKNNPDLKVCSNIRTSESNRVDFTYKDKTCKESFSVNFDVDKYYVYRFDNSADASSFEDLDLDGYNDADELDEQKCDVETYPIGGQNFLVQKINQTQSETVKFSDTSLQKGKNYWYRFVSVTSSARASNMSAPISAFIPKREYLDSVDMSVTYKELEIIKEHKIHITTVLAKDSLSLATKVRYEFLEGVFNVPFKSGVAEITQELKDKLFKVHPQGKIKVSYLNGDKLVLSSFVDVNSLFIFRKIVDKTETTNEAPNLSSVIVIPNYEVSVLGYKISTMPRYLNLVESEKTLEPGDEVVGGCVELHFDSDFINRYKNEACLQKSLKIGNNRYSLKKDCNISEVEELCTETFNGEMSSVGVKFVLDSGATTPETYVNYIPVRVLQTLPYTPVLKDFKLDYANKQAKVKLQTLIQRITGAIVEFNKEGSDISYTQNIALLGKTQELIDLTQSDLDFNEGDTWCVRAKNIGTNGAMSPWSEKQCIDIAIEGSLLDSLTWPKVSNRVKNIHRDLNATFNPITQRVEILLDKKVILSASDISTKIVTKADYSNLIAKDMVLSSAKTLELKMMVQGKSPLDKKLIKTINIVKYFDNFYLPKKVLTQDEASRVNLLIFTFKDKTGATLGDSVEKKLNNVLKVVKKTELNSLALVEIHSKTINRDCVLKPLFDKYSNYVVYRQELGSLGQRDGNFVQISPLIQKSVCTKTGINFSNNLFSFSNNETTRVVKFADRYPYEVGSSYRYMFLFFDQNGEPVSYSLSNPDVIKTY